MLRAARDAFLSLVYPQECRVCYGTVNDLGDGPACAACWSSTRFFDGNEMLCTKCGAFFSDTAAPVTVSCHQCDDHHYDKASALGIYEKALSSSIISLKTTPWLPATLKRSLQTTIGQLSINGYHVIVPIPLSKPRHIERGFNQAELVATAVHHVSKVSIDAFSLQRRTHTTIHRVGMDRRARELTVQNAFVVRRPKLVADKRVLLVDDVFTSGATASACAKALKKSGAARVDVFTLARAVMR